MGKLQTFLEEFKAAFYSDDVECQLRVHEKLENHYHHHPNLRKISQKCAEYQKFLEEIDCYDMCLELLLNNDWDLEYEGNDILVESRGSGADFVSRASLLINASILPTLSVITETDLLSTWVQVLNGVEIIAEPTNSRKLGFYNFWFPWPLSDRQCVLEFSAYPVRSEQGVLIMMKTPETSKYLGAEIPAAAEGLARMNIPIGGVFVQYISPILTKVVIVVQANGNISSVPDWLFNFGTKRIMYYLMDALRNQVLNFQGSIYERRVAEREEYYRFICQYIQHNIGD
ncbi:unnamed protein product [Blepharisma stoltei]|uniref:START domain-containing protein n=1 Tax=Blepharisma stoltei TaxID=1481888 RepID=A0AAU9IIC8_9CILI|nr:unnamed protein product [Blepharisma stoltei]